MSRQFVCTQAHSLQIFCLTLFVALTGANVDYIRQQTECLTREPVSQP